MEKRATTPELVANLLNDPTSRGHILLEMNKYELESLKDAINRRLKIYSK